MCVQWNRRKEWRGACEGKKGGVRNKSRKMGKKAGERKRKCRRNNDEKRRGIGGRQVFVGRNSNRRWDVVCSERTVGKLREPKRRQRRTKG